MAKEKARTPTRLKTQLKLANGNDLLTSKQVGDLLLLAETTITHRKAGTWRIPYVELGDGVRKRKRFLRADVEAFIESQREPSRKRIEKRMRLAS